MDWLFLLFLSTTLIFILIRFTHPSEQKFQKAIKLTKSEHFQEAYDLLHSLSRDKYASLVGYSDDTQFMSCQGFCLLNLARYQEAVEVYDHLIKKISDVKNTKETRNWLTQIYLFRGIALLNLELSEQAIVCFDRAIEYQSDCSLTLSLTLVNKANALCDLDKFDEAIECCDRALQYEPNNYDAWLLKAHTLYELQDYRGAMSNCEYVLQYQPTNYLGHELKSKILYGLGNYPEAIISCNKALQYQPDYVEVIYGKACCYALLDNIELAIENLQQVIDLDPQADRDSIYNNEDFANLRQNRRFQELIHRNIN